MKRVPRFLIYILLFFAGLLIQSSVLPAISIGGISPNVLLILIACISIFCGETTGMTAGFFSGLILDVFFGSLLGFYALIYLLIGYIAGKIGSLLYVEDIKFPLIFIAFLDFLYGMYCFVFQFLFQNRLYGLYYFRRILLPEIIYTGLFALVLYPVLSLLYKRVLREKTASELAEEERSVF